MGRLQEFYDRTIEHHGYRISPRMPLKYRVARSIQRMFMDERGQNITMGVATTLTGLVELSLNIGGMTCCEYYSAVRGSPHKRLVTRLKGYPDGGVSIFHYEETLPHHPMILRSHVRLDA